MRKTKRIVWLAAAALAAVLAIVAGCKHDDEDDWTPLTIRNAVLEKYAGERTTLTIPDGVTGIGSRAFSGSDVTAVVIPSEVTSIAADAFDGSKVKSVSFVALQEDWNGRPEYGLQGDIKAAYFIIDKNGMLTGYEGDETDVVIPAGFVKGIADGVFRDCAVHTDITVVTIPGSVRGVGENAFAGCTALVDVRIEAGVADIGDGAFAGCTELKSATIPAGARRLGGGIFNGCTGLTGLSVHESVTEIASGALAGTERLEAITYTGRKAQWEKLVVGKERDFAGKRVYCQDGEDWWYGPERDTTTPGDNPGAGDHKHTLIYKSDGESGHYRICTGCNEQCSETEAHVYDDEDVKCTVCGYRKAKPGNSECVHDWDMKSDTDGHYQECTHCGGIRNSENHTWGSYENDGAGGHKKICTAGCEYSEPVSHNWSETYTTDADKHYKTCTISGCTAHDEDDAHDYNDAPYKDDGKGGHYQECTVCGYQSDPVSHKYKYEKIDDGKHRVTCEVCDYSADRTHDGSEIYTSGGADGHYRTCASCGEKFGIAAHDFKYEFDKDNHQVGCKVCDYSKTEAHVYDDDSDTECNKCGYAREISGDSECDHSLIVAHNESGHYQKCTKCDYQSASVSHEWGKAYTNGGTSGHYQNCTVCGYQSDPVSHKYKYEKIDDGKHHVTCEVCDYFADMTHDWSEIYTSGGADGHYRTCTRCGYSAPVDHKWSTTYTTDADRHYKTCTISGCTAHDEGESHTWSEYKDNRDGTHSRACTTAGCGYTETQTHLLGECESDGAGGHQKICTARCGYSAPVDHKWSTTYTTDANKHYKTCMISGCIAHDEEDAHDYNGAPYQDDGNGKHYQKCTVCDYSSASVGHEYKYEKIDDGKHHVTCKDCGYFFDEEHKYDDDTVANCNKCGYTRVVKPLPGSLPIEGGTLTIDAEGKVTEYKPASQTTEISVAIPNGVTGIDDNVFAGHHELTNVTIPGSVDTIGGGAFQNCSGLTSVTISNGVKNIEHGAFEWCVSLTEVAIPGTVESVGQGAFQNCTGLKEATIEKGVKEIGADAFQNCSTLTKVTIPDSVESIGDNAFVGCPGITDITIPASVTNIGDNALACSNLKTITFTGTIAQWLERSKNSGVGDNVTVKCSDGTVPYDMQGTTLRHYWGRETAVEIPWNSVETIGNGAFATTGVTSVKITEGVKHIGDGAFQGCGSLTKVEIPMSMESIGNGAFYGCSSLTEIEIPASVKTIGKEAFSLSRVKNVTFTGTKEAWDAITGGSENIGLPGDVKITFKGNAVSYVMQGTTLVAYSGNEAVVTIPNGVTAIGEGAFKECTALTGVTIPDSVTTIGDNAFQNCAHLTSVSIPAGVTSIGVAAFNGCAGLTSVEIPAGVTSIEKTAFSWCTGLTSVTIPAGVKRIGINAFSHCTSLAGVTFPDGLETIGEYAFEYCTSLASLSIPASVKAIDTGAFSNGGGGFLL